MTPLGPVVAKVTVPVARSSAWALLARQSLRADWWPDLELDARAGGLVREHWEDGEGDERVVRDANGTVDIVVPEHALGFRWQDSDESRRTAVLITLASHGGSTTLTVTETGFDSLNDAAARAAASHEGWSVLFRDLADTAEATSDEEIAARIAEEDAEYGADVNAAEGTAEAELVTEEAAEPEVVTEEAAEAEVSVETAVVTEGDVAEGDVAEAEPEGSVEAEEASAVADVSDDADAGADGAELNDANSEATDDEDTEREAAEDAVVQDVGVESGESDDEEEAVDGLDDLAEEADASDREADDAQTDGTETDGVEADDAEHDRAELDGAALDDADAAEESEDADLADDSSDLATRPMGVVDREPDSAVESDAALEADSGLDSDADSRASDAEATGEASTGEARTGEARTGEVGTGAAGAQEALDISEFLDLEAQYHRGATSADVDVEADAQQDADADHDADADSGSSDDADVVENAGISDIFDSGSGDSADSAEDEAHTGGLSALDTAPIGLSEPEDESEASLDGADEVPSDSDQRERGVSTGDPDFDDLLRGL
ncbi:SRPBCC domain-containing protein [Leucobacter sp. GX24907]